MLLSVLVLIGTVLVPDEYVWLYSTHIILLCLYLFLMRRYLALILTVISLVSVCVSEFIVVVPCTFGNSIWFDFSGQVLYQEASAFSHTEACSVSSYSLRLEDVNGDSHYYHDLAIEPLPVDSGELIKIHINRVLYADRNGNWRKKELYISRQVAEIYGTLESQSAYLAKQSPGLREKVLKLLDDSLVLYSSWRFSKALVLGNDDTWDQRDKWLIRVLGLAHLFVVSGLHTGFVFIFGCLLSRAIWHGLPSKWVSRGVNVWLFDVGIVLPILIAYAYLTNWGAPVVRASLMLSFYLLSKLLYLYISPYKFISLALWLILLFNPRAVFEPGLWLSFSLVCLLVAFFQLRNRWHQMLMIQFMLSTASFVLVWGWQEFVSVYSILINLIMIPLAGLIWFPLAVLACVETLLVKTTYLYSVLDKGLVELVELLKSVAFELPLFRFNDFVDVTSKGFLLVLILFWVWQTPLRRGWFCVMLIWCVLILPREAVNLSKAKVSNINGYLVYKEADKVVTSEWGAKLQDRELMLPWFNPSQNRMTKILLVSDNDTLTPVTLLRNHLDWLLFAKIPSEVMQARLSALSVHWLSLKRNENLFFRFDGQHIKVYHSACSFAFFLFKSDTCRRVEKLEFMLN